MTSNRLLPPADYPAGFHAAIQAGGGVFYAADLPWTPLTAAKRFRQLLTHLRKAGVPNAKERWRVEATPRALVVTLQKPVYRGKALSEVLIGAALKDSP